MQYLDPIFLIDTLGLIGVLGIVFAESGLFLGFFLPGDSLLFTAGLLASENYLNIFVLISLAIIAAVLGDTFGYAFGKKIGPRIFTREHSIFFSIKNLERSKSFFGKHGKKAIILARFMPAVRTFTPILAGAGQMPYKTFITYNIVGGAGWVTLMAGLGYFFGRIIPNPDRYILPVIVIIIVISIIPSLVEFIRSNRKTTI
ncbi:MAG: VTT domain-containing protein [bacterium]